MRPIKVRVKVNPGYSVATVSGVDIGGGSRDFLGLGLPIEDSWAMLDKVAAQRPPEAITVPSRC
jgi:hypothetical protein